MIRANREVAADRRLFNNINRHLRPPQLTGEPDIPPQNTNAEQIRMMLRQLSRVYSKLEAIFTQRINTLESKVITISKSLHKIVGVLHAQKQNKLYSFANSPNSKDYITGMQTSEKYAKQKMIYSSRLESQASNKKHQLQNTYIDGELSSLQSQIQQLRKLINYAHEPVNQIADYRLSFESQQKNSAQKTHRALFSPDWHTTASPYNTDQQQCREIQRYKAIVAQYKKQDQILRIKADKSEKYRLALMQVVEWLRHLKQNDLPAYLPCEAQMIKQSLKQIFKLNDQIALDFQDKAGYKNIQKKSRFQDSPNDYEELLMDGEIE